jgi:uracil-DNA glycosylase family 4
MRNSRILHDEQCRRCARLAAFLDTTRAANPTYFCKPVPPFGPARSRLLIVGLAPGMHGANRTGRPFTGDHAGILLYRMLHRFGFASSGESNAVVDSLRLIGCRITNAVKCLPPQNRPTAEEVRACNRYLAAEFRAMPGDGAILALGAVAHGAVLRAAGVAPGAHRFAHGASHTLPGGARLFDSYHCSRYNTSTRRLSETMFGEVFADIREFLSSS